VKKLSSLHRCRPWAYMHVLFFFASSATIDHIAAYVNDQSAHQRPTYHDQSLVLDTYSITVYRGVSFLLSKGNCQTHESHALDKILAEVN
jgi:hypothetical protein